MYYVVYYYVVHGPADILTLVIVRLYHEGTKQYLAVQGDTLMLSGQGTPFFLANGQFRAYHTPRLHLVTGDGS